jgi:hypothetical protein
LLVLGFAELFEVVGLLEPFDDFVDVLLDDLVEDLLEVELLLELELLAVLLVDFAGAFLACVSSAV